MKTVEKIIEELEVKDIKRIGERTGKNVTMSKPLTNNSKIEFEYDKDGKLLSRTIFKDDFAESKYEYKYECYDSFIIELENDKISRKMFSYNYFDTKFDKDLYVETEYKYKESMLSKIIDYRYTNINRFNILLSIHINNNEILKINNLINTDNSILLEYINDNKSKTNITINMNNKGLITSIDCSASNSKTLIKYDENEFLSETEYSFINHLGWKYIITTKYDYNNMTKIEETKRIKVK